MCSVVKNHGVVNTTVKTKLENIPEVLTINNLNYELRGFVNIELYHVYKLSVAIVSHCNAYCKILNNP